MTKRLLITSESLQMLEMYGQKMGLVAKGNLFGYRYRMTTANLTYFQLSDEFETTEEAATGYSQVTHFKTRRQPYRGNSPRPEATITRTDPARVPQGMPESQNRPPGKTIYNSRLHQTARDTREYGIH